MNLDIVIRVLYGFVLLEHDQYGRGIVARGWKIDFCIVDVRPKVWVALVFHVPIKRYDCGPFRYFPERGRVLETPRYRLLKEDFSAIESEIVVVGGYPPTTRKSYLGAFSDWSGRLQGDAQVEVRPRKCCIGYGGWNHHRNYDRSGRRCRIAGKPIPVLSYSRNIEYEARQDDYEKNSEPDNPLSFQESHYLLSLALKYSPSTALTALRP